MNDTRDRQSRRPGARGVSDPGADGSGRRRRELLALAAFVVFLGALASLLVAVLGGGGENQEGVPVAETTSTTLAEAFAETPQEVDFSALGSAKFISVMLENGAGVDAFSLTPEAPEFRRLVDLLPGKEIDLNSPYQVDATLVFVSRDRATTTFEVDLGDRLLVRGDRAWQVEPAFGDVIRSLASRSS